MQSNLSIKKSEKLYTVHQNIMLDKAHTRMVLFFLISYCYIEVNRRKEGLPRIRCDLELKF